MVARACDFVPLSIELTIIGWHSDSEEWVPGGERGDEEGGEEGIGWAATAAAIISSAAAGRWEGGQGVEEEATRPMDRARAGPGLLISSEGTDRGNTLQSMNAGWHSDSKGGVLGGARGHGGG